MLPCKRKVTCTANNSDLHCHSQELEQVQNRSTTQVAELQALAEQQFKRASALSEELDKYRRELVEAKKQVDTLS